MPRETSLATQVRQLQIVGAGSDLRTVELQMAGNQRSLMTIEPLPSAGAGAGGASTPR